MKKKDPKEESIRSESGPNGMFPSKKWLKEQEEMRKKAARNRKKHLARKKAKK